MPGQLPAFVDVNGEWPATCARLYAHFEAVFKANPRRTVRGKPLIFDARVLDGDFEEGFWHVITSGKGDNRLPDMDRARRICWLKAMLDGTASGITRWSTDEGDGSTKLYFWLEAEKYVLILSEKPRVVALVTAFYVRDRWTERDLVKRRASGTAF